MKDSKDKIDKFISENKKYEIKSIIDMSNRKTHFSWSDFEEGTITPKTWGNAIENYVLEPINKRQYELQNKEYILNKLEGEDESDSKLNTDAGSEQVENKENTSLEGEEESDSKLNTGGVDEFEDEEDTHIENNNEENKRNEEDENDEEELPEVDVNDANWTKIDKAMGLASAFSIIGFAYEPVRNIYYSILNPIFGSMLELMPFYLVILIIAFVTTVWSTYVKDYYIDSSANDFKKHVINFRDDGSLFAAPEGMSNKEEDRLLKLQHAMIKSQVKPFVWILSITIPSLLWIFTEASIVGVGETIIFPFIGTTTWGGGLFITFQAYIIWYILISVVSSQIIKRILVLIDYYYSI